MGIQQIIDWGKANPRKLFLVDGCGAILSAVLLGLVLVRLEHLFGIPRPTLYFLVMLPCFFAVYDFCCYFQVANNPEKFLKGIAIANMIYCCLSIGLAIYHREVVTGLGWIYILIEIGIVATLANIEIRVANSQ